MLSPVSVCFFLGRLVRRITQTLLNGFPLNLDGGPVSNPEQTRFTLDVDPDKGPEPVFLLAFFNI